MKVSIVIPAFNEVQTIAEVPRRIAAANADAEIVVIDDGSTDGTRDVLHARSGITVMFHGERRQGGPTPC
jgi:glycosyltransferase involved in cell wall biosynthesis